MGLLVLAAGTAFVLSSVRDSTKWTRLAARVAWILLLGRWVAPVCATMWMERDRFAGGSDVALLAEWTGRTIFDAGLGLWLLASFTLAAVVRELSPAPVSVGAAPLRTAS